MKTLFSDRTIGLIATIIIIIVLIVGLQRLKGPSPNSSSVKGQPESAAVSQAYDAMPAPEIVSPSGFLNTDGITIKDLVGKKVILVDFWTYSCINCQRTLPYLTAWYEKYADQGLEIVGIHTPEFEFEKKHENVVAAAQKFGVTYPVVLDNEYGTWRAYGNRYWPRKYLINIDGDIVYDHIGEGAYEETEQKIQELLEERAQRLGESGEIDFAPLTQEEENVPTAESPETYFGALRNRNFGNGKSGVRGEQMLVAPEAIQPNQLYLDGTWNITDEYARNVQGGARVLFKYKAQKVYMVARADSPVQVMVRRDGEFVQSITVQADQLYTIIDDNVSGEHTLELMIVDAGLEAFTFTFG